jgi:hypothetical protein
VAEHSSDGQRANASVVAEPGAPLVGLRSHESGRRAGCAFRAERVLPRHACRRRELVGGEGRVRD